MSTSVKKLVEDDLTIEFIVPAESRLPLPAEEMEIAMLNLAQRQSACGVKALEIQERSALEIAGLDLAEDAEVAGGSL
jgi:hypothetical protein